MILQSLVQLGRISKEMESIDESISTLDKEIVDLINTNYPDGINSSHLICLYIDTEKVINALTSFKKKIEEENIDDILSKCLKDEKNLNKRKKIDNKKLRPSLADEILSIYKNPLLLNSEIFSIKLRETKLDDPYLILQGNQKGTKIYSSPTIFIKVKNDTNKKYTKIDEFPLWKIKLVLNGTLNNSYNLEENNLSQKIIKFINLFPSLQQYNYNFSEEIVDKENEDKAKIVFNFIISEIFRDAINTLLKQNKILLNKAGMYYFPFLFDGKWPYEIPILQDYFKNQFNKTDNNDEYGICYACGVQGRVSKGLTSELGFYTINQEQYKMNFFEKDKQFQLCKQCQNDLKKGFNLLKSHPYLNIYLGSRGKKKAPYLMYVIPIAKTKNDLKEIVEKLIPLYTLKKSLKKGKRIIKGANIAQAAKKIQSDLNKSKESSEEEKDDSDGDKFIDLLINSTKKKHELPPFSIVLIIFYHPSGNASAFHNVSSVDVIDYENLIILGETFDRLNSEGKSESKEKFSFKDIFYIFGSNHFRKYILNLLKLKKMDLDQILHDVYLHQQQKFFKYLSNPEEYSNKKQFTINMKNLKIYLNLLKTLDLLNVSEYNKQNLYLINNPLIRKTKSNIKFDYNIYQDYSAYFEQLGVLHGKLHQYQLFLNSFGQDSKGADRMVEFSGEATSNDDHAPMTILIKKMPQFFQWILKAQQNSNFLTRPEDFLRRRIMVYKINWKEVKKIERIIQDSPENTTFLTNKKKLMFSILSLEKNLNCFTTQRSIDLPEKLNKNLIDYLLFHYIKGFDSETASDTYIKKTDRIWGSALNSFAGLLGEISYFLGQYYFMVSKVETEKAKTLGLIKKFYGWLRNLNPFAMLGIYLSITKTHFLVYDKLTPNEIKHISSFRVKIEALFITLFKKGKLWQIRPDHDFSSRLKLAFMTGFLARNDPIELIKKSEEKAKSTTSTSNNFTEFPLKDLPAEYFAQRLGYLYHPLIEWEIDNLKTRSYQKINGITKIFDKKSVITILNYLAYINMRKLISKYPNFVGTGSQNSNKDHDHKDEKYSDKWFHYKYMNLFQRILYQFFTNIQKSPILNKKSLRACFMMGFCSFFSKNEK